MQSHRNRRSAGLLAITLSTLLALLAAAPAAAKNPPGNNGTVKVDRSAFDDHPNNEPHVGCTFQVDFYGFDADPSYFAQVIFELHAPTRDGRTLTVTSGDLAPFIGEDDQAGGGSEAGLDASQTYTLAFTGEKHPQQGYHVKLTVHAPGSQGADTKHKVFWVSGCDPAVTPPTNPPGSGGTDPGSGTPPRGGTSPGTPPVVHLPDTATTVPGTPLALLAGAMLLGGSATLAVETIRRRRPER